MQRSSQMERNIQQQSNHQQRTQISHSKMKQNKLISIEKTLLKKLKQKALDHDMSLKKYMEFIIESKAK